MNAAGELLERVAAGGLLAPERRVLVLLSGGRDSVCLLDVAVRVSGLGAVRALHINYGLREQADEDERHCVGLCEWLGVELAVKRAQRPPAGNLQAWARDFRYEQARELAAGSDVATGHTASDQVETILYRLASSPSRRALLGMRAREGPLIRPLIVLWREQTAAYCEAQGLSWREDPSNLDQSFARNRVRARLVPALREIHPAAEPNVLALSETLRDEAAVLDEMVAQALGGREEISLHELRALAPALRRLLVQELADRALGAPASGVARRAPELVALGENAALDLPHVRAIADHGMLRFVRRTGAAGQRAPDTDLNRET